MTSRKTLKMLAVTFGVAMLAISGLSLAATTQSNKGLYYTSLKPVLTKSLGNSTKAGYYPATDITVYNDTGTYVALVVPDSPVDEDIYPHSQLHVYNNFYSGKTEIVLYDSTDHLIFDRFVWNHAVLHVVYEDGYLRVFGG